MVNLKKKLFVKILFGVIILLIAIIAGFFGLEYFDETRAVNFVKNENLKTVKADWQGTSVDEKGRFVNYEFPYIPKMSGVLKWQFSRNQFAEEKRNDTERLKVLDPTDFLNSEKDGILWLGHASVYIRLNGKTILLDPVFGNPSFLKRFVYVPNPLEKIKKVDYVLLSHDHRDHTDEATLRSIAQKFPNAKFLAGLRMEDLLNSWKTETNEVQTAGWFQQFQTDDKVKITFVPVRHWCRRGLNDTNHRLWGGYVVEGAGKTIYFGGDSGFGSHYKDTAEAFPNIDFFIIGIGAYEPRWFMKPAHNNPSDALQAFVDAKAKLLIPMHYGTFDQSDEPPNQPLRLLKEEAEKSGQSDKLKVLTINESFEF